jgi:hypothetical protein
MTVQFYQIPGGKNMSSEIHLFVASSKKETKPFISIEERQIVLDPPLNVVTFYSSWRCCHLRFVNVD